MESEERNTGKSCLLVCTHQSANVSCTDTAIGCSPRLFAFLNTTKTDCVPFNFKGTIVRSPFSSQTGAFTIDPFSACHNSGCFPEMKNDTEICCGFGD